MIIVGFLQVLSILVMLIAALGVIRLPGALARQHAATKAATLSVSLFIFAFLVHATVAHWGGEWLFKLVVLMLILLITLPLAAHALGRSALNENEADKTVKSSSI
jgi:multicomponent Na+:H+ antiporter subunit G